MRHNSLETHPGKEKRGFQKKAFAAMNADTKNNILTIALEAAQLELERARMRLEDQQSKVVESIDKLTEEVGFLHNQLYHRKRSESIMFEAACDAMEVLHPGDPDNYDGCW